jgi:hypothetical protein
VQLHLGIPSPYWYLGGFTPPPLEGPYTFLNHFWHASKDEKLELLQHLTAAELLGYSYDLSSLKSEIEALDQPLGKRLLDAKKAEFRRTPRGLQSDQHTSVFEGLKHWIGHKRGLYVNCNGAARITEFVGRWTGKCGEASLCGHRFPLECYVMYLCDFRSREAGLRIRELSAEDRAAAANLM